MLLRTLALFFFPVSSIAQDSQPFSMQGSMFSMILSLLVVVGVILVLAVVVKKLNINPTGNSNIKIVSAQPIGTKERIVVIEVNGEQHLLGVTQQSVNHLFKLDQALPEKSAINGSKAFKDRLQQVISNQQQD